MWFARGVQSAIFYYATCTPCAAAEDRRRRKKEAIRTQREQAKSTAVVTDQPRPFPQPTPFSTNAGWMEEIALGPGPPTRRHRTRNNQSDALPRLSSTSSMTVEGSVMSAGREKSTLSERFHWSRFQREDEVLWGEEEEEEEEEEEQEGDGMEERRGKDGAKAGRGSSVGIPRRFRSGTSHSNKYYIARAPPVNDLHPPIVSGPTSRAETRWMLQPPPSAKVMAGKARHDEFRESRTSSVRRRSRMDFKLREAEKEEEAEDEEPVQEGQLSSISERPSWLMSKATNSYRRACENHKKHRPATLQLDTVLTSPDGVDGAADPIQPPPTAATTLETPRSTFMTNALAYDEWHLPLSPSFHSPSASPSSMGSLDDSLQWPDTPYSRPDSKRTPADSSNKGFHPSYLNLTVAANRDTNKSIEAIHLEINEPRSRDQMQPPKWRWSFDI